MVSLDTHALFTDLPIWADVPTALLRAELLRREDGGSEQPPACGSGHVKGSYNTPLHVGALILVLTLSTLGMLFL
jgi:zinc transporter 1/2/3